MLRLAGSTIYFSFADIRSDGYIARRIVNSVAPSSTRRYILKRNARLFILRTMATDGPAVSHAPRPLSLQDMQFRHEVDTMTVEVSEFSSNPPTSSEGCTTVAATVGKASEDVILEDNWALDTRNPRNWPLGKKWAAVIVVSSIYCSQIFNLTLKYVSSRCDRFRSIPSSLLLSAL